MKEKFGKHSIFITLMVVVLVVAGCQSGRADSVNMLLQPDSPTMVSFPLMAASQVYDFTADAQLPIQVSLMPITNDLSYTAELRDERGSVMATVSSSAIQNAVLTVGPGSQHYQVAIKSNNTNLQGILSMQVARTNILTSEQQSVIKAPVQSPIVVPYQPPVAAAVTNNSFAPCSVSSKTGASVNLRNGPGLNYAVVDALAYGTALSVSGKTGIGWYQVIHNGQVQWVAESVTALAGDCKNLPDVMPFDPNNGAVKLSIGENGWGSLNDSVTSVSGSANDLILVTAPALVTNPQYEEFTLTLVCSGNGADNVRWGAAEKPTLKCGSSVVMPMTSNYRQQVIAVSMPLSAAYDTVQYTLMASRRV
ncbi:MAG: SH3 domain-containing protein [Anaerolineaceae bacterium]|nr:SH3 domain-containing protein [Anaerolineaceae bacterium]